MKDLEDLKNKAVTLLKNSGYPVKRNIKVEVDKDLPYMGYTTEIDGGSLIVVSEMSLQSGMVLGLLVHELGHVYRTETKHPSHDYKILYTVFDLVFKGRGLTIDQERIIHGIINHLQDLYADDISFKVFSKNPKELIFPDNMNEFFTNWVGGIDNSFESTEKSWRVASAIISTAFAQANLDRHNIRDTNGKLNKAVANFLSRQNSRVVNEYYFIEKLMMALPESVSEQDFSNIITEYLRRFLTIVSFSGDRSLQYSKIFRS